MSAYRTERPVRRPVYYAQRFPDDEGSDPAHFGLPDGEYNLQERQTRSLVQKPPRVTGDYLQNHGRHSAGHQTSQTHYGTHSIQDGDYFPLKSTLPSPYDSSRGQTQSIDSSHQESLAPLSRLPIRTTSSERDPDLRDHMRDHFQEQPSRADSGARTEGVSRYDQALPDVNIGSDDAETLARYTQSMSLQDRNRSDIRDQRLAGPGALATVPSALGVARTQTEPIIQDATQEWPYPGRGRVGAPRTSATGAQNGIGSRGAPPSSYKSPEQASRPRSQSSDAYVTPVQSFHPLTEILLTPCDRSYRKSSP
jgi:hypothetical protein